MDLLHDIDRWWVLIRYTVLGIVLGMILGSLFIASIAQRFKPTKRDPKVELSLEIQQRLDSSHQLGEALKSNDHKIADVLAILANKVEELRREHQKVTADVKWCRNEIARLSVFARKWESWWGDTKI